MSNCDCQKNIKKDPVGGWSSHNRRKRHNRQKIYWRFTAHNHLSRYNRRNVFWDKGDRLRTTGSFTYICVVGTLVFLACLWI